MIITRDVRALHDTVTRDVRALHDTVTRDGLERFEDLFPTNRGTFPDRSSKARRLIDETSSKVRHDTVTRDDCMTIINSPIGLETGGIYEKAI